MTPRMARILLSIDREGVMKKHKLTTGQIAFVVGTRVALAAGVGLLVSRRLPPRVQRALGMGLVALGVVTTIPAARTLFTH